MSQGFHSLLAVLVLQSAFFPDGCTFDVEPGTNMVMIIHDRERDSVMFPQEQLLIVWVTNNQPRLQIKPFWD